MGFSEQEYWNGLPLPSPGDLPNLGLKPTFPALAGGFFTAKTPGKPICCFCSVGKLYPDHCDPMDCSTPGFPVLHWPSGVCSNSCPFRAYLKFTTQCFFSIPKLWVRADIESLPHPGQQLAPNKPGRETTERVETAAATETVECLFTAKRTFFFYPVTIIRTSLRAQLVKNPPAMQETPVQFLGQEEPLEKG